MSRSEADYALRGFDAQVDMADDCYEASLRLPAPATLDPSKPPIRGG